MALQIYNTLTRMKETFVAQESGKVKIYVCGPTVYDYIHIGNARPMIFFDVVRAYFENQGNDVSYVVNFTDVDDKMIRKAEQTGTTVPEVADKFIQAYYEDLDGLGIPRATLNPRVTDNMENIIEFIQELVDRDFAYENGGDVFYRTRKFDDYGKLSQQNLDELQFGIRIEVDKRKENPEDFVLWKAAKPGEIYWSSPWGDGRPGWHIECSAMARRYLGDTLDIHGGGQDLQFPHHECEVAQSEALTGKPLANYWMHNGYIRINNEKMSKSLGNGVLVKELREQYTKEAVRYFMLSTHYRNPLNYSDEVMDQAQNSVERLANAAANIEHRLSTAIGSKDDEVSQEVAGKISAVLGEFHQKMQDDFNTPDAITAMFQWASEANQLLKEASIPAADLHEVLRAFNEMNGVLRIVNTGTGDLLDEEIEALIAERIEARKNKNWARADEIRDKLADEGIVLEDTAQGMRWRRK
ncbi:cysteinyl-tRNA synthetase [Paenibacillus vortex V453]|jgi:cysteinyl-tRNA synthetase|uniref:Cysteine--tRNA ligase n=3 Tax=Paenibacillus TaxID=44249 RepID=A0A163HT45_9BACL|nr:MULTISPECIES: cysteine--tRNA ligase [Paenibacillus]ANA79685.1 cysteine--tRNA ligase [Paenibacillus glucanolyticus]AVV56317.1 cysteine--tRNA ligase [Paenibacillus glucanolyticus]AWP25525.1 cysteine--tRNA ligase [Paenibacillus sp. Cedars]EFU38288.1 cysteinyl-tRNA synthetase [Paenibacillus vortex V453]ETT40964.1 cysteinyl-tRNA ligase [Paenibacillus sp. FSL R5-808]